MGASSVSPSTPLSPSVAPPPSRESAPTSHASPTEVRQELTQILSQNHSSMKEMSGQLLQALISHNPEMGEKIQDFQQEHSAHITTLQNNTWNELKEQLGTQMTQGGEDGSLSLEAFRGEANRFIAELTALAGKEAGLPEIQWTACGTEGYNSDVDTAMQGKDLSPEGAVLYKTLRDNIHTHVFGGLSGVQLDTESYVPHPAKMDFSSKLVGAEAKAAFATGERANVILQRYVSLFQHGDAYEASKQRDLQSISDPSERKAMDTLYRKVETFMSTLDDKIYCKMLEQTGMDPGEVKRMPILERKHAALDITHANPRAFKEAREVVMVPMRLSLGNKMMKIQERVSGLHKQLEGLQDLGNQSDGMVQGLHQEMNALHLESQKIFTVINLLQDEGTNTAAEGDVTLFKQGGQIHAGAKKRANKTLLEKQQNATGLTQHLIATGRREVLESHSLGTLRQSLNPDQKFKEPTGEMLLTAAYEESTQFEHVIEEQLTYGAKPEKAAISAGKYCQRTCRNNLRALQTIRQKLEASGEPIPRELKTLTARAKRMEAKATALEQCKRKFTLNTEATTTLLAEIISQDPSQDPIQAKAQIQSILGSYAFGEEKHGQVMTKEEHLSALTTELSKRGLIEIEENQAGQSIPSHEGILHILQGRVGYDRTQPDYAHLNALHARADTITIQALRLDTSQKVHSFSKSVLNLGAAIRNFAHAHDFMAKSDLSTAQNFNLATLVR